MLDPEGLLLYIKQKALLGQDDSLLLAVSGGVDSMVMLHLFHRWSWPIAVAHVNYKMRGEASDLDALLVSSWCQQHNVKFHSTDFPEVLKSSGNFQNEARKFRYQWMEEISNQFGYTKILTAHHKDDVAETFFINLLRGSGLEGLTSLKEMNGQLVRPLLSVSKNDLLNYAQQDCIEYRNDESNSEDNYLRNFIRNKVLSVIHDRSELYQAGIDKSMENLRRTQAVLSELLVLYLYNQKGDNLEIDIKKLQTLSDPILSLYLLIKPYGFNLDQARDILTAGLTGKKIKADRYEIIKGRETLLIVPEVGNENENIIVEQPGKVNFNGRLLHIDLINISDNVEVSTEDQSQKLYFSENPFPLILRSKAEGDVFQPSGMQGKSKFIKKFFTDEKKSEIEKRRAVMLVKEAKIISVFPYRTSHLVQKNNKSKFVLIISELK